MMSSILSCWWTSKGLIGLGHMLAILVCSWLMTLYGWSAGLAGGPLQSCAVSGSTGIGASQSRASEGPSCGIEITCTDKPVQLGYSDGVCFRATCPGIWAMVHKRTDQASFRRRHFSYRHYAFTGAWELKDQGVIESGPAQVRELFLVLPDDLIELKLRDPDCNAAIEVVNIGYIKKGSVEELKKWLAYNIYLERPLLRDTEPQSGASQAAAAPYSGSTSGCTDLVTGPIGLVGRMLGLPWFQQNMR